MPVKIVIKGSFEFDDNGAKNWYALKRMYDIENDKILFDMVINTGVAVLKLLAQSELMIKEKDGVFRDLSIRDFLDHYRVRDITEYPPRVTIYEGWRLWLFAAIRKIFKR